MARLRISQARVWVIRRRWLLAPALLLLLWLVRRLSLCGDESAAANEWLRHDRSAARYVRPGVRTALLDLPAPCGRSVRLLLAVASAPASRDRRQAVRETWGGALLAARLIFLLGHDGSALVQPELRQEASQHGDIVVEDLVDNYHNLTLKTLFMLKWAVAHCGSASYVMKTDDDMLVNVRRVLREVQARGTPETPFVFGHTGHGEPQRSPCSKWYLPEWLYAADRLPNFLTGAGYVISRAAVTQLLERAMEVPLVNLEDVYLTGLVAAAREPHVPLLTAAGARVERPLLLDHPCLLHHAYLVHGLDAAGVVQAWHLLQALDPLTCGAAWLRFFAMLLRVEDFRVVLDAGWGPPS